jgi:Zinc-finger of the MIZ type in Nse subunit
MDRECKARHEVCATIRNKILLERANDAAPISEVDVYKTEVDAKRHTWTAPDAVKNERFIKKIDGYIALASGAGDDELVMAESGNDANRRCPVTGGEMELPLVNTTCGHVYSTAGIIGLLCQANRFRLVSKLDAIPETLSGKCPVAGCQSSVSKGSLERDFAAEMSQRQARKAAANRRTHPDDADLEDEQDLDADDDEEL